MKFHFLTHFINVYIYIYILVFLLAKFGDQNVRLHALKCQKFIPDARSSRCVDVCLQAIRTRFPHSYVYTPVCMLSRHATL
jgi:hypothetical protein